MKKSSSMSLASQQAIAGYMFIIPFLIGFVAIVAIPLILSIGMSFTDLRFLNLWRDTKFVRFDNFTRMFHDKYAMDALLRSLKYAAIFIPSIIVSGLVLALLINEKLYFRNTIRTMIFLPYISNMAAIALVWSLLLDPSNGPINMFLKSIGGSNPPLWLVGANTALPTSTIIVVWMGVGFHFITYLAALQGVPGELYEAAKIDGANLFGKLIHITIPMISNTTFFLIITSIIMAFQNFSPIYVLTRGGPGEASKVLAINIYNEAFLNSQISYANSQAVLIFTVLIILTRILWKLQSKWEF